MPKEKIIAVEWDDIAGGGSWEDKAKDYTSDIIRCHTVGYQLKSNRKVLVIASTVTDKDRCCDRTIIPRAVIKSLRVLV